LLRIAATASKPADVAAATPPYVGEDAFARRKAAATAFDDAPAEEFREHG
jgi:hypothetical protein